MNVSTTTHSSLRDQWRALRTDNRKVRARQAAEKLGVTEAQLVASETGGAVVKLDRKFGDILKGLKDVGPLMALTRNASCVHEKTGVYDPVRVMGKMGLALSPEIDLRIFFDAWASGFFVEIPGIDGKVRPSLQFFDPYGDAVHKIYAVDDTDKTALRALVTELQDDDQTPNLEVAPAPERQPQDGPKDVELFRKEWLAMKDTHEFFDFLKRHEADRLSALRAAPEGHARRVDNSAAEKVLNLAQERDVPIMVFVGNRGCIQIHTGPVKELRRTGPWFNVLDPGFNLHLRTTLITESWVVRKPTSDGIVTSLECYDEDGEIIVQFFGERKPGKPELVGWRELAAQLA